ncbi:hypothetical protein QBC40DRAFT_257621 [Triangularia verruculosa]|uniref:Peptidase C1A papain C-terminal domain-containing protein n=1 Tax=Triangularia verruculosa TaxID=2587418 RepID=A0AAN6XCF8_9PEZI|nr:hypothetical protein QBC40DRAFT_257621 [Triangularia verruculosa]
MPHEEFPDNFLPGAVFDQPDPRDKEVDMSEMGMSTGPLPAEFSVLKAPLNYKVNKTGAFNQGYIGTCMTNAVAQLYLYELQRQGVQYADYVPSRLFLYYVARYGAVKNTWPIVPSAKFYDALRQPGILPQGDQSAQLKDSGSSARDVIKIMRALGAPPEDASIKDHQVGSGKWPYDAEVQPNNGLFKPNDWPARLPDPECFRAAVLHQALGYARPGEGSAECWKRCIQRGYPIVFSCKLYDSWWQWGNGASWGKPNNSIWPIPRPGEGYGKDKDHPGRRHALVAVGWDDNKRAPGTSSAGAFYVQNSWGPTWGENGFSWMPYEWLAFNDNEQYWPWAVESPWTFMQSGKQKN